MATTLLVVSDLHLGDGDAIFDGWESRQQGAFADLLSMTHTDSRFMNTAVELIINGDCFDFLASQPSLGLQLTTNVTVAHAKWANILTQHGEWFTLLRNFLSVPNHRVTFLIGNHDIELLFPSIRARVRSAINAAPGMVRFCLTRSYQPLEDVVIDHGCQLDPANFVPQQWQSGSQLSTSNQLETVDQWNTPVGPLQLPWGSRYFASVFSPLKARYPYLDALVPFMPAVRQIALLCLIAPHTVIETMPHLVGMMNTDANATPLTDLPSEPLPLFVSLLPIMQQAIASMPIVDMTPTDEASQEAVQMEVLGLFDALSKDMTTALEQIISTPTLIGQPERPNRSWLGEDAKTRFLLLGHTHVEGRWLQDNGVTVMNTGTWTGRYVRPTEGLSVPLAQWLAAPKESAFTGQDGTRFTFAWLHVDDKGKTSAELLAWQNNAIVAVPDDGSPTLTL